MNWMEVLPENLSHTSEKKEKENQLSSPILVHVIIEG